MAPQMKWVMKKISALGHLGNTEAGVVSSRVDEGARIGHLVHLPEKVTALRLLFFWMLFPGMDECGSDACVVVAVLEPIVKPGQLKMGFPRIFLQTHLLS